MVTTGESLGNATLDLRADGSRLRRDLGSAERDTRGVVNRLSGVLKGVGIGAGIAVAGIAAAAVKSALDIERGFAEVRTLLPQVGDEAFGALQQDVLNLTKEFGVATDAAIPALYQAISAGVPRENVLEFLEIASRAATGGVTDLETAVDGITSVVNAYGSDVISATEASDQMFTAVRLGKTNFEELSRSLFNVIPTAASLGIGFEEITAQLAAITAQGTPTKIATTQLRQLFVEASKSGSLLSNAIQELAGDSFSNLIAEGGSATDILQRLRDSMPDQEFRDLFGAVEAAQAALLITGRSSETVNAALDATRNSAGATEAAFDTMAETTGFQLQRAIQSVQTSIGELGLIALPVVARILSGTVLPAIQGVTSWLGRLSDAWKQSGETTSEAGEDAETSGSLFDLLIGAIRAGYEDTLTTLGVLKELGAFLGDELGDSISEAGKQFGILGVDLSDHEEDIKSTIGAWLLFGPVAGPIVDAINKVAGEFAPDGTIRTNINDFLDHWDTVWGNGRLSWGEFTSFLPESWSDDADDLFAEGGAIHKALDFFVLRIANTLADGKITWSEFTSFLPESWSDDAGDLFAENGPIHSALTFFRNAFEESSADGKLQWSDLLLFIPDEWERVVGDFFGEDGGIAKAIKAVRDVWNDIWDGIKSNWETVWNFVMTIWDETGGRLFGNSIIIDAITNVKETWDETWDSITAPFRTVWNTVMTIWDETGGRLFGVDGTITKAIGAVQDWFDGLDWGTTWEGIWGALQTIWDNTGGLLFGEDGIITKAIGFAKTGAETVWGLMQEAWALFLLVLQTIWDNTGGLLFGEEGIIAKAIGFAKTGAETIWGLMQEAWALFLLVLQTIWDNTGGLLFGEDGIIAKAIGFAKTGAETVWGLMQEAWALFLLVLQTIWDNTGGLLFGEDGIIAKAIGFAKTGAETVWGLMQEAWALFLLVLQTIWDNTGGLLFGEDGIIAKAIGFAKTGAETIWGLMQEAWALFLLVLQTVWDNTGGLLFGEEGIITKAVEAVQTVWNIVWGALRDNFNQYINPIISKISGFIDRIRDLIDAIGDLVDWIANIPSSISLPSVPSLPSLPSLPSIDVPGFVGNLVPNFQSGVTDFRGGIARVHEGELLTNLPRGSDVIPAGAMGGSQLNVNFYGDTLGGDEIEDKIRTVIFEARRRGIDLGFS